MLRNHADTSTAKVGSECQVPPAGRDKEFEDGTWITARWKADGQPDGLGLHVDHKGSLLAPCGELMLTGTVFFLIFLTINCNVIQCICNEIVVFCFEKKKK